MKTIIKEGDTFVHTKAGLIYPTIIVCKKISTSWFRKRKPYGFMQTFMNGRVAENKSLIWFSEEDVQQCLNETKREGTEIKFVPN